MNGVTTKIQIAIAPARDCGAASIGFGSLTGRGASRRSATAGGLVTTMRLLSEIFRTCCG
ncbi:hypothetical protein Cme02nite_32080 [Catellatospora methionotrophica]|uniref:Uncharacterized protein n=1 Tax=Catellatospora methionotrophica TaxID=121620 RepID=A0A8J3PH08_9ACTN|nr:hypothetical protein Cme02nite_32080 [Catellatospora methionotrophica]